MFDPSAYLAKAAGDKFIPGQTDCAFWCGAWCEICCGVNPVAAWRGRYRTIAGYRRLLKREGGLEAAALRVMADHQFPLVDEPEPGTIALVDVVGVGEALGIAAVTRRLIFKGWPTGIVIAPEGRIMHMWSPVTCRR